MKPILGRFTDIAYALMRVVAGLLFAQHGAQKLFGVLGGTQMLDKPLMVAAGGIELVAGLLVAIGLLASIAAFVAAGEMAFAYFMVHAPQGFWPIVNKGDSLRSTASSSSISPRAVRAGGRWNRSAESGPGPHERFCPRRPGALTTRSRGSRRHPVDRGADRERRDGERERLRPHATDALAAVSRRAMRCAREPAR